MSRPSRGFTVTQQRAAVSSTCPTTGTTSIDFGDENDWIVTVAWSGTQVVGVCSLYLTVNGGPSVLVAAQLNIVGTQDFDFDPHDYGVDGDTIDTWAVCTHVAGCPDFSTVLAEGTVAP